MTLYHKSKLKYIKIKLIYIQFPFFSFPEAVKPDKDFFLK